MLSLVPRRSSKNAPAVLEPVEPSLGPPLKESRPEASAPPVAVLDNVTRVYGDRRVLDAISLEARRGELLGVIGPSGCGKTTLVKTLVGLESVSDGSARVFGKDPVHFTTRDRERIGYTPQGFVLYPTLTVIQNANFVAGLYGLAWRRKRRRVEEVLRFLELWEARNRLARDISGGMQRRLSLACALFHDPDLLFVDEPTAGLDPILRAKVWGHLAELRDRGRTVFVTTQHLDEAEYCDRVAVIARGRVIAIGSPEELRRRALGGQAIDIDAPAIDRAAVAAIWNLACVERIAWRGTGRLRLLVDEPATAMPAITQVLHEQNVDLVSVQAYQPTFDEVFAALMELPNDS